MVSTSEIIVVVVSVDTADLVRFPSSSLPPRSGSRPGRQESSLPFAACTSARQPWMVPYATWREPRCCSPMSSQRRTRRWEEVVPLSRPPRHGSYSCAGPRCAAASSTSRCLLGVAKQDVSPSGPRSVLTKTQIGRITRSKTHRVGGAVHP
jgi:hypothetical protein